MPKRKVIVVSKKELERALARLEKAVEEDRRAALAIIHRVTDDDE